MRLRTGNRRAKRKHEQDSRVWTYYPVVDVQIGPRWGEPGGGDPLADLRVLLAHL